MPLTNLQSDILAVIGANRTPESYLAGGTVLHFEPNSRRFSRDLDIFHDVLEAVAPSFEKDAKALRDKGFSVDVLISQPGFIRAQVARSIDATQIDWARDSAFRFMPAIRHEHGGFLLHEVDAATNKILALAARSEPRDYVDTIDIIDRLLPLGPLVWAASAKDPGFTPLSLLELIRRQGRYQPEEINRLDLARPFDMKAAKEQWLNALADAEAFIDSRPPEEAGCLYWDLSTQQFTTPTPENSARVKPHFGTMGGILPTAAA